MEPGESDGRGDGKRDASGVVFEELEERLWVPPTKHNRDSQNGETSNGDRNGDANLEDDDHGNSINSFLFRLLHEYNLQDFPIALVNSLIFSDYS